MNRTITLNNKKPALFFLLLPSLLLATDTWARPTIQAKAVALQIIPAPTINPNRNCLACHTAGIELAGLANLKPGYRDAYFLDTNTLTKLKAIMNILPTTTVGLTNSGLAKTDIYEVICAPGGVSLESSVKDLAPLKLPIVSTQVTKGTSVSPISNDTIDGDAAFSKATKLVGGAGAVYSVKVNKSAYTGTLATHKGPETYTGLLACKNAAGAATGLAWRTLQNQ